MSGRKSKPTIAGTRSSGGAFRTATGRASAFAIVTLPDVGAECLQQQAGKMDKHLRSIWRRDPVKRRRFERNAQLPAGRAPSLDLASWTAPGLSISLLPDNVGIIRGA